MTEAGDIYLAALNEEQRRRVLVVSTRRFNLITGRVLIEPEILGEPDEVPFPWRVNGPDAVFAVDFLRSIPAERLLERRGAASYETMTRVRRAIVHLI